MKKTPIKSSIKKFIIYTILGIYFLNNFSQFALYTGDTVSAARVQENITNHTNLVAVFVDSQIYTNIKSDIERYTTKYIQGSTSNKNNAISNSKAIVFPIDTNNFSAKNIVQILENMYFDGIKGESSNLVGIILIGDIPLPVVNQNGYIYPTIYPYVDFEEQKFIWDDESKYFVYNDNTKGQAEIWHGIINFGNNTNDYRDYFEKIRSYRNNPNDFVDKAMRYDDFIGNNNHFNDTNLNAYLNNFIFSEDIGYHRYSNLLLKVLQGERNNEIEELMGDLNDALGEGGASLDVSAAFDALGTASEDMAIPTASIKAMVDNGYLASYIDLFSQKYLKTITNNVETANRWSETRTGASGSISLDAVDTHYKTVELLDDTVLRKDGGFEPFLIMINNALEDIVDKKVEDEKYWLEEVLPLTYLKYRGAEKGVKKKCYWDEYEAYENFYFGENAKDIENAEQTSTYRGTYREWQTVQAIDGITIQNVQSGAVPSTDISTIDLNKKGIGGSYDVFAQQVDANRGYNYNNGVKELEIYNNNKVSQRKYRGVNCVSKFLGICWKRRWSITTSDDEAQCNTGNTDEQGGCEGIEDFALRFRGGASTLNLTGSDFQRKSGYFYSGAVYPIFDIGGGKRVSSAENDSTSFKAINTYAQLIQRKFSPDTDKKKFRSFNKYGSSPAPNGKGYDEGFDYDVNFTNRIPTFNANRINGRIPSTPLTGGQVDYFSKFQGTNNTLYIKTKQEDIIKISKTTPGKCQGAGEIYTYKTIDSRVKNDSVNQDELTSGKYRLFQDKQSRVLKFYNGIMSHLNDLSGEVTNLFDPYASGGIIGMFSGIDNSINEINSGLTSILQTDINVISEMQGEPEQISALAESWNRVLNETALDNLSLEIDQAYESLNNIKGLLEQGTGIFDTTITYISNEITKFKLNNWPLKFYFRWKLRDIPDGIVGVRNNFMDNFSTNLIQTLKIKYNNIDTIVTGNFSIALTEKIELINQLQTNESGENIGCTDIFAELCDTINIVRAGHTVYSAKINSGIYRMNSYMEYDEDDEDDEGIRRHDIFRNITNTYNRLKNLNTSNITAGITSALSDVNISTDYDLLGTSDGINQTTSDRPIDSPRYLTFKGIAGNKVTFIYPNIYKVEVFSGNSASGTLELKTPEQIANSIRSYLTAVAKQYNAYLKKEMYSSSGYYNRNKDAFDLLSRLSKLATPNNTNTNIRPYGYFSEDYLIRELENRIKSSPYFNGDVLANEDPILFIANMIYYQNVSRPNKFVGATIQDDIDYQKANVDMNEKVAYTVKNYLTADNNRGKYLSPNYRDKGYEVAFINTNGNDNIDYEAVPDVVQGMQTFSNNYQAPTNSNDNRTELEEELITECNIPIDEGVMLFDISNLAKSPWLEAMKCRWERIKEKPLEIKVTFPFSWDEDESFRENIFQTFNPEAYEEIADLYATQLRFQSTTQRNQEILENAGAQEETLKNILNYVEINTALKNIRADNAEGIINVSSAKSFGDIDMYMINIGKDKITTYDLTNNKPISNNITLGTNGFTTGAFAGNEKFDPYSGKQIKFSINNEPEEGLNVIVFYLCPHGTTDIQNKCVMDSLSINVVPGSLKDIDIQITGETVLEGATIPFIINGVDKFGNNVGDLITQNFDASVNHGTLSLDGNTAKNISFSKFDNTKFTLNAFEEGENLDRKKITISVSGSIGLETKVRASKEVNVVKGKLKVQSDGRDVSNINVTLPNRDYYYLDGNEINQVKANELQKIDLELVKSSNGTHLNLDGRITIRSKNGILEPGKISQKDVPHNIENGETEIVQQYKFVKSNYFDLSGGRAEVYFYPSFTAGEDTIYITMKGIDDIEIPVTVSHASPAVIQISTDKTALNNNSSTHANLKIYDNRNNPINERTKITLISANDKISLSKSGTQYVTGGSLDFEIYSHEKGGKGYVYAYIDTNTTPLNQQKPGNVSISLQKMMIPETGLNVMYLNLFGNDWGNQRGILSDNNKYSEKLIKNSDKLITVTTQLVSLENIKHFPAIIDKKLHINNLDENPIYLNLSGQNFVFNLDGVGKIVANNSSFNITHINSEDYDDIQEIEEYIINSTNNSNTLYYISEQTDSIIESNEVIGKSIHVNGKDVFNLTNGGYDLDLEISLNGDKIAGYQVWEVRYQDNVVGQIILVVKNENILNINLIPTSTKYNTTQIWINGTTQDYGMGFYEIESTLPIGSFGYKSIQDSYDSELGIGFTADFKNITNFGGGMNVGESTIPFGSELLINIGDPLLKRIDGNKSAKIYDQSGNLIEDTKFDMGIGEVVYSSPDKDILKTIDIDFNVDGLKDIIVIFKDGTIKILKNYGGTNPFQALGALTILADRISDVSIGDVDGNGYPDLIIWTESGLLRVYLNNAGVFDVDGYPVCININVDKGQKSQDPEHINDLHQIFLKDMDLDGAIDIITNDNLGFIKIFYGGKTDGYGNYLSTNKYSCDTGRYDRLRENENMVYQFGIKIDNESHIIDQSLIRRQGISPVELDDEDEDAILQQLGIDSNTLTMTDKSQLGDIVNNVLNFDVSSATSLYQGLNRLKTSNFNVKPIYEPEDMENIEYVEIGCLTGSDPVKVYKTYENVKNEEIDTNNINTTGALINGDLVRVNVYIQANSAFTGTYIDNIMGPWMIPLSQEDPNKLKYFWFDSGFVEAGRITTGQIEDMYRNSHRDLENSKFMLDNIHMQPGQMVKFSYGIVYQNDSVIEINIEDITAENFQKYTTGEMANTIQRYLQKDNYPDISVQPEDGCNDSLFIFFNNKRSGHIGRTYDVTYVNLIQVTEEYNENSEQNGQEAQGGALNSITTEVENENTQSARDQLGGLMGISESIDWQGMLDLQEGLDLSNGINVRSEALDAVSSKAMKKVEDAIGSLCNGIDLGNILGGGGGCGLPVPFNQAFLGPGKYHLFGCFNLPLGKLEKGLPIFFFPGTITTAVGTIPFPRGQTLAGTDEFIWAQGGVYPSLFRIYLMPTLTTQIGVAMCFGPYTVGEYILDPVGSIAGNCIVFAADLCRKKSGNGNEGDNPTTYIPKEYSMLKGCSKQNIPCYVASNESTSPFMLGSSSANSNSFVPAVPDGDFAGGIISIEKTPVTLSSYREDSYNPNTNTIVLKGGADSQNKILGSLEQGLIAKVIKSWLDKQINYIMTNLTNRKISITWPDFSKLVGDRPSRNEIVQSYKTLDIEQSKENCDNIKGNWDSTNNTCTDTVESLRIKCENRGKKRTPSSKTCVEKPTKNANESAISNNDEWIQTKLISRDQIANRGDSLYSNPFDQLRELFNDSSLVNINTKSIYITVPMVTNDDLNAYISLSQNWLEEQEKILKDRQIFFSDVLGYCGGSTDINGMDDIEAVFKDLKKQLAESKACSLGSPNDKVTNIEKRLNAIKSLKSGYNLSNLGAYQIYEAIDGGFYVYTQVQNDSIIPDDVYLYYDTPSGELRMFTRGYSLSIEGGANGEKKKLTLTKKKNGEPFSNEGLHIKQDNGETTCNSCADMFIDGTLEETLGNFVKMQSSFKVGAKIVKENIETLEQYKQFPLQLYEWIHVTDKYIGDISNLISSTLGTLSMWMETNANRYSQYVDAIISIITTLETYQLIIDLSADWSKKCSTCTNDNYDQFSCKLGLLCPDGILPIIEVPSTKFPSIYIDFSEVHLETDITLPNFKFTTKPMTWPELPNLPSPPDIDLSMSIDEAVSLGMDLTTNLFNKLKAINIGFGASNSLLNLLKQIPTIPSPPVLPDLPSFVPTVQMQLPNLPPAPKIPELPNGIKTAIKVAKAIGKILCIVKGKIGLVAEQAVKAKVEQITQRNYQIPFRDNFDQTVSSRNSTKLNSMSPTMAKMFSGFAQFLQADKFKEANLQGYDLSLQTYINLQFNFNLFFSLVENTVNQINKVVNENEMVKAFEEGYAEYNEELNIVNETMQACVDNPFSEECLGSGSSVVARYNEKKEELEKAEEMIHNGFEEANKLMTQIESKKDEVENINTETEELNANKEDLQNTLNQIDRNDPQNSNKIEILSGKISEITQQINDNEEKIRILNDEISELQKEYNKVSGDFKGFVTSYITIQNALGNAEDAVISGLQSTLDSINIGSGSNWDLQLSKGLEADIKKEGEENELQKTINKKNRATNIQNLYRDVEGNISYIDYNAKTNSNNFAILKDTLSEINKETTNKEIKDKAQEYLTLVTMDREIKANTNSLKTVKKNYDSIINEYKASTEQLSNEIINDYDKFLAKISNDSVSLVNDDFFNINLSAQLFDMKEDTLNKLLNQESITKTYMDYNMKNVNGYLNAMGNHSAKDLNMNEETYKETKEYLSNIKKLGDQFYAYAETENQIPTAPIQGIAEKNKNNDTSNEPILVAQSGPTNPRGATNTSDTSTVDIANYIDGYTINTEEGTFLLSNRDYTNKFQGNYILTDINNDNEKDLILRDNHNVYIKYRSDNNNFEHYIKYSDNESLKNLDITYNKKYYSYPQIIRSYDELKNASASNDGFVKIDNFWIKLYDVYQEVKNFKYAGENYDSISISRQNSEKIGDYVDGYIVKMIHRVDQFNDKENLLRNYEELFDKKYFLVLPKGTELTGKDLQIDNTTIRNIEQEIGTGDNFKIFGINYYTDGLDKMSLTITDIPRYRQYSEIYSLKLYNNTYKASSSSSNQIVAGPQIIADDQGPDPTIKLYRPTTDKYIEGTNLEGYVGTHYILQIDREDNVALDRIWIANTSGITKVEITDINNKTGYLELTGLYFTGTDSLHFYAGGEDTNGNSYVADVNLIINIPSIEITDVIQGKNNFINIDNNQLLPEKSAGSSNMGGNIGFSLNSAITNTIRENAIKENASREDNTRNNINGDTDTTTESDLFVSIKATLEHDIDSGYVQFLNNRNETIRTILTGNSNTEIFKATPGERDIYGGYFGIGNTIGLYSTDGKEIAALNPTNGKITTEADNVSIKLDLSHNTPIINIIHSGTPVFRIKYTSQALISLDIESDITVEILDHEDFKDFNGGKALMKNGNVIVYVSPIGQIYIPDTSILTGEYNFDESTKSVEYILYDGQGRIGSIKVKIKNLIDE